VRTTGQNYFPPYRDLNGVYYDESYGHQNCFEKAIIEDQKKYFASEAFIKENSGGKNK